MSSMTIASLPTLLYNTNTKQQILTMKNTNIKLNIIIRQTIFDSYDWQFTHREVNNKYQIPNKK